MYFVDTKVLFALLEERDPNLVSWMAAFDPWM